jgi:hypothetical protein
MSSASAMSAWTFLGRGLRFFYLLWGGMLLTTLSLYNRLRVPARLWEKPEVARFLVGPWGRGMALGLGLVMAIAALIEVWELVDRLLVRFMSDSEREH